MQRRRGPFGGGNQWLNQTADALGRCGYALTHSLTNKVALVLGTHAGFGHAGLTFSYQDVLAAKARHHGLRCVQRINDNDLRKGTSEMDPHLAECNQAADHTVFVSQWLRDYHAEKWFDVSRPHSVITNGADPSIFHPLGARVWKVGQPLRICTHHWSDNPAKGFPVYQELDRLIASGEITGVEFWVIGRWPKEIEWKATRTFAPCAGKQLADILRQCHVCLSASRYEPGAMHPVEALACGLPLLYTPDTGGTVELGQNFGVPVTGQSLPAAIEHLRGNYQSLRTRVLEEAPSGDQMCLAYRRLVQTLISNR